MVLKSISQWVYLHSIADQIAHTREAAVHEAMRANGSTILNCIRFFLRPDANLQSQAQQKNEENLPPAAQKLP